MLIKRLLQTFCENGFSKWLNGRIMATKSARYFVRKFKAKTFFSDRKGSKLFQPCNVVTKYALSPAQALCEILLTVIYFPGADCQLST